MVSGERYKTVKKNIMKKIKWKWNGNKQIFESFFFTHTYSPAKLLTPVAAWHPFWDNRQLHIPMSVWAHATMALPFSFLYACPRSTHNRTFTAVVYTGAEVPSKALIPLCSHNRTRTHTKHKTHASHFLCLSVPPIYTPQHTHTHTLAWR